MQEVILPLSSLQPLRVVPGMKPITSSQTAGQLHSLGQQTPLNRLEHVLSVKNQLTGTLRVTIMQCGQ